MQTGWKGAALYHKTKHQSHVQKFLNRTSWRLAWRGLISPFSSFERWINIRHSPLWYAGQYEKVTTLQSCFSNHAIGGFFTLHTLCELKMNHFDKEPQSHLNWMLIKVVAVTSQRILNDGMDFGINVAVQNCEKKINVSVWCLVNSHF